MPQEIIPKVLIGVLGYNRPRKEIATLFEAEWHCPVCMDTNKIFLFSETRSQAMEEARSIKAVQCESCTRKFEVYQ